MPDITTLEPVLLWPDGAPGALGDGPEDRPTLTPLLPPRQGPSAAVIVCPGGGYQMRAGHEREPVARWLCGLGLTAFVLDYRVAPYRHPAPLSDAQRAIRLVRANAGQWGVDASRVGILGFSAGGHLAASTATIFEESRPDSEDPVHRHSSRPDALIACYPVITFGPHRHDGSMRALLGDDPPQEMRQCLSLENRVTGQTPPTFLWHTADDAGVPVENSLLFAMALRSCGVPFALHVFPRGRHGLGLASGNPELAVWRDLCAAWLGRVGFLDPARQ